MRNRIGFIVFFSLMFLASELFAQEEPVKGYYDVEKDWFVYEYISPEYGPRKIIFDPANKIDPTVNTSIVWDNNTKSYVYNFKISNGNKAKQLLFIITIKFFSAIFDQITPNTDWDMGEHRVGRTDTWQWSKTMGELMGIPPGGAQEGFIFKSKGLPSIVDMFFWGERREEFNGPSADDPMEIHESFDRVSEKLESQYPHTKEKVTRKTIGPKNPPADFKPIDFLNYIIDLKHQSTSLGWIKDKGIEQSLDAKLDNAKKKIEQGNNTAAKNILEAFINEVEAQNGKHLTSEAYGLLKYNAQYLIEKIQ